MLMESRNGPCTCPIAGTVLRDSGSKASGLIATLEHGILCNVM